MKKRVRVFLIATVAMVASLFAFDKQTVGADTTEDGAYNYTIDYYSSSVTIDKYNGSDASVSIPAKIDGYKVTTIGEKAFYDNNDIEEVTIPSGVKRIEEQAFEDCDQLSKILFPDSLEEIYGRAFAKCEALTSVSIPACNLEAYWISGYITNKYRCFGAFYCCSNLETVTIKGGKEYYIEAAFRKCEKLKTVKLGKGCTKIDSLSFYECKNLETVNVPSTVQTIEFGAFKGCTCLNSINISKVTSIPEELFFGCNSLSKVELSSKYTYVGKSAFAGTKIKEITVPKTCTYAGFNNMPELKKLTLKNKETDLQVYECPKLTNLILPSRMERLINLDGCNINKYVVPACVDGIPENCFRNNLNAKIYILNPNIYFADWSIPGNCKIVIYGYKDSTAQEYAKNCGLKFKAITTVTSVKATNSAKGTAKITWKKVSGAEKYTIYRSTSENGTYEKIGTSKTTSYTDKKASKGTTYYYKISIDYTDKDGVKLSGVMSKPAKVQIKR